jgi:PAS domain-containing protein
MEPQGNRIGFGDGPQDSEMTTDQSVRATPPISPLSGLEGELRQLLETMNEGFGMADADCNLTYVNRRLSNMLGYDAGDLLGHHVTEFMDSANGQLVRREMALRRQGHNHNFELTWL